MGLTWEETERILRLLEESHFAELRLELGDLRLHVQRAGTGGAAPAAPPRPAQVDLAPAASPRKAEVETDAAPSRAQPSGEEAAGEEGLLAVRAPMLGTFYRCPQPGAPPFVEQGDRVGEDDTVALIEVMKVFTAVKAGVRGRVARVCARDGQLVEYGQTLFLVEPGAGPDARPDEPPGDGGASR